MTKDRKAVMMGDKERVENKESGGEKLAIVTGASGGIGYAISEKLSEMGYKVYGIGRDFEKLSNEQVNQLADALPEKGKLPDKGDLPFVPVKLDLRDNQAVRDFCRSFQENKPEILVHSAGVAYYGFHESLNQDKISEMMKVNLETPLFLSQFFLRDIKEKRGHIFFISSVTALHENSYGAAYGATKAGLLSFARSLFAENRKSGLKVHSILPDMTDTNLYRNADFTIGENSASFLLPSDVASAVETILKQRDGVVLGEVHLRPQVFQITRKPIEKNWKADREKLESR